jgi:lipopolysaccharide assembly protein A
MTEQPASQSATSTLPPQSANGTSPQQPPTAPTRKSGRTHTRIRGMRTGLIAGFGLLIVVMIFIIQNPHAVNISFLGAHLRLSLAVALLLAGIAGALIMAAAGTARVTQLRRIMRRDRREPPAS